MGDAFEKIRSEYPRENYYLATKVGRYGKTIHECDYRAERIYESVNESLNRLKTDYLDIVYAHDVEFVKFEEVVGKNYALDALFDLKAQGKIKYVGCSGKSSLYQVICNTSNGLRKQIRLPTRGFIESS